MKNKFLAFYLRLSMSDGDLGENNKDESNSIENQRDLLENYVEEHEEFTEEVKEYVDDGYTGTNFNRPGFQQLLKDAGKGEISTILVKDLSRLGRDYIGVGDYVEQIFPMFNVRFIAVNNCFDSAACVGTTLGLDFAVSNLINNLYSRDVSKKIRSSYEVKWKQGHATAARVPFGYKWNKNSEQKWEIDPVSAGYVREVFDYALEGNNTRQIAVKMNAEHIPTPGVYARANHKPGLASVLDMSPDSEKCWGTRTVWIILTTYEYTGALVMRKHMSIGTDHVTTHSVPKEDQFIIENAHDAIVTVEEYDLANEVIRKIRPRSYQNPNDEFPLRKIVRCGNCRRLMKHTVKNGESGFCCRYPKDFGSFSSCRTTFYRESEINTRVLYAIRQVIRIASALGDIMEYQKGRTSLTLEFPDTEKLKREIEKLKAERVRQYEAYADRVISREVYLSKKTELSNKISSLEEKLQKVENAFQENEEIMSDVKEVADANDAIQHGVGLTADVAQKFVESVYIYDENRMEIVFKCEDVMLKALDKCTANTDGVLIYPTAGMNEKD